MCRSKAPHLAHSERWKVLCLSKARRPSRCAPPGQCAASSQLCQSSPAAAEASSSTDPMAGTAKLSMFHSAIPPRKTSGGQTAKRTTGKPRSFTTEGTDIINLKSWHLMARQRQHASMTVASCCKESSLFSGVVLSDNLSAPCKLQR